MEKSLEAQGGQTSFKMEDISGDDISPRSLVAGTKVPVLKNLTGSENYHKAEILAIREDNTGNVTNFSFYVHYLGFNKRLDEWVSMQRLNMKEVEWPPKNVSVAKRKWSDSPSGTKTPKNSNKKSNASSTPSTAPSSHIASRPPKSSFAGAASTMKHGSSSSSFAVLSYASSPSPRPSKDAEGGPANNTGSDGTLRSPLVRRVDASGRLVSASADNLLPELDSIKKEIPSVDASDNNGIVDGRESDSAPSYEEEMAALRRGGSMTMRTEELARVKNISTIEMGRYRVNTWYFSPYPESLVQNDILYICETCLEPFPDSNALRRHRAKCAIQVPPGNEIYRKDNLSFFEIDGHKQKAWCRNLCLLSKLFLDHKTLYYDVDPFLFYILTSYDEHGHHIVGYFSKEKESADNYNVACILTLPQHQRKGYGKFLIHLSYELSKIEGMTGSPEKPLSDLGLLSYRSYWSEVIMSILTAYQGEISIQELSTLTSITTEDILHTLQAMDLLKYYKGQHVIVLSKKAIEDFSRSLKKSSLKFDSSALRWVPPTFTASQLKYI